MATVPAWVPKFTHGAILDLAAKRSTGWVDVESRKEYARRGKGWAGGLRAKAATLRARARRMVD